MAHKVFGVPGFYFSGTKFIPKVFWDFSDPENPTANPVIKLFCVLCKKEEEKKPIGGWKKSNFLFISNI